MDLFDKFYLELTKLNYHFKTSKELTGKYQTIWGTIQKFIPIFNRIIENDIPDLNTFSSKENKTKDSDTNIDDDKYNDKSSDSDTVRLNDPFLDELFSSSTNKTTTYYNNSSLNLSSSSSSNDYEDDDEGDKQVIDLTSKSLKLLEQIQNNMWVILDHCDSTNNDDTNSTSSCLSDNLSNSDNDNDNANDTKYVNNKVDTINKDNVKQPSVKEETYNKLIKSDDYEEIDLDNFDGDFYSNPSNSPQNILHVPDYTNNNYCSYLC